MTDDEKTQIAVEAAGIIIGRILRGVIIIVGIFGLLLAGYTSGNTKPAEPVKVEQVKKKPAAKVKAKKAKRAKKACACKCPKPEIKREKITIEPQKLVDIEAKLN